MSAKPLREEMPEVAHFVDALRAAFGREAVDPSLSRGLAGEPVFFATEAGRRVGTACPETAMASAWHAVRVGDRYYCKGCDGSCVGTERSCAR
jgi:hypothetical protein